MSTHPTTGPAAARARPRRAPVAALALATLALGPAAAAEVAPANGQGTTTGVAVPQGASYFATHPRVTVRRPAVSSPALLAPEAVQRVLRRNLALLSRCYEELLATDPGARGEVLLRFRIDGRGTVTSAAVARAALASDRAHMCIVGAVSRTAFPSPVNGVDVNVLAAVLFEPPTGPPPPRPRRRR